LRIERGRRRKTEDRSFGYPPVRGNGWVPLRPKTEDGRQKFWIPSWEGLGVGSFKTEDRRQKTGTEKGEPKVQVPL